MALTSTSCVVPTSSTMNAVMLEPTAPPSDAPPSDESEQPLGLTRVVNEVGERPELADEQDGVDLAEQVEADVNPQLPRREQDPEDQPAAPPCQPGSPE